MAVLADDCELWANERWNVLSIDEALKYPRGRLMRCRECLGVVRAHAAGKDGQGAHFEHEHRHEGCSRSDAFNGTRSPHPTPARMKR